jgi:DNA-binding NarL/FixJ family response regulator
MRTKELVIMVVDDHPLFRSAVVAMFKSKPYITRIYEATDGYIGIKHLTNVIIDVVLLDINMPKMNGIECLKKIKANWPEVKVIMLTQYSDSKHHRLLMSLGADGYIVKSTTENILVKSFEEIVFENKTVITGSVDQDAQLYKGSKKLLGARETQILALICHGLKSHEIAEKLNISIHTVNNHRKAVLKKSKSASTAELIHWAKTNGVV